MFLCYFEHELAYIWHVLACLYMPSARLCFSLHPECGLLSFFCLVCVGIKGNPPYMDHQLPKAVKSESTWTFGQLMHAVFTIAFSHMPSFRKW